MKRRDALKNTSFTAAFLGLNSLLHGQTTNLITGNTKPLYGSLIKDPNGLLDLPQGFSYQIISQFGDSMTDGLTVPGKFDGMAAFSTDKGNIILIRNHEIGIVPPHSHLGPFPDKSEIPPSLDRKKFYDIGDGKKNHLPHCGGTSTIVYNPKTAKTEKQYMSLIGTDRNCAGGAMPWGTWISAEEPEDTHSPRGQKHGYCFEVKATEEVELQAPKPLTQLGRFRHEAVALDPRTGILYLTEDRKNGLFYRFIPEVPKDFTKGKLQALALGKDSPDTRNYSREAPQFPLKTNFEATWIDLQDVDTPFVAMLKEPPALLALKESSFLATTSISPAPMAAPLDKDKFLNSLQEYHRRAISSHSSFSLTKVTL